MDEHINSTYEVDFVHHHIDPYEPYRCPRNS